MGKGCMARPFSVSKETFNKNWDKAFRTNNRMGRNRAESGLGSTLRIQVSPSMTLRKKGA